MQVILDHTQDEALNIRTFWFKPKQPLRYTAGQYTELTVPHDHPDERGIKHWFTISSSPTDKLLSITTKFNTERSSTFKRALWALPMGTQLHWADAMGDFVLPKDKTIPLVLVAGGIGVTPFHSMVKWLTDTGEKRRIQLIYGARVPEEVAFRPLLESYADPLQIVLSEPAPNWTGEKGRLSAAKILELAPNTGKQMYYLSGPEPMIKTFEKDLLKKGLGRHQVVIDDFPGYTTI